MGRAYGRNATVVAAAAALPRMRTPPGGRLRGFSLAGALSEYNAAASERAHISRLVYDLATHAAERALTSARPALSVLDETLGLADKFGLQLADTLRERTHFGLHSELRVALDEGRRLAVGDIDELASSAVYSAAAGLLIERSAELADTLGVPNSATSLSAGQWYKLLCAVPAAANPRAYLQEALAAHAIVQALVTV